jgi:hypothetical protein
MIKSRRMRWARHVARMGEKRNVYRILVGKPEGRRPLGRPRRRWVNDNKLICYCKCSRFRITAFFYLSLQNLKGERKIGAAYQAVYSENRKYAEPKQCSLALVFMKKNVLIHVI